MNEPIVVCIVVEPYHINRAEHLPQQLRMRSSIRGLHGVNIIANRYSGGLLQWDMWAGID
jgi:hypothetical protein